ncbi:unnamed protein product [Scytosiphon promiscuus]
MVSPLRSPMPRGERTREPRATADRGGDPPAAAATTAVATEETFNPTLGSSKTWSFLSGLAASSARGGATNGVSAAINNGVPRATNGVSEADSNNGAPRATNGVGARARSKTTSDSDDVTGKAPGGNRTGSPVGQMLMGLIFPGMGSSSQQQQQQQQPGSPPLVTAEEESHRDMDEAQDSGTHRGTNDNRDNRNKNAENPE